MKKIKGNFTCFADGISCRQYTYLDPDDSLPYATLLPGEKIVGSLTYVVPDGADPIEIEYDFNITDKQEDVLRLGETLELDDRRVTLLSYETNTTYS